MQLLDHPQLSEDTTIKNLRRLESGDLTRVGKLMREGHMVQYGLAERPEPLTFTGVSKEYSRMQVSIEQLYHHEFVDSSITVPNLIALSKSPIGMALRLEQPITCNGSFVDSAQRFEELYTYELA